MSLYRYLPTPSDRMGVIWSLLSVEGGIVLEYGPAGTTHYSMGLYGGLGIDFQNRLFTTHLSEDDVVMGSVVRLEEAILELDAAYSPKIIFIVASSTTSIIGTDIKGVCKYMQKEVRARLVPVDRGGFQGDYSAGISDAYKILADEIALPDQAVVKGSFNIIGASMNCYRMASDLWELQNLLSEGFGLKMHTCLCSETSIEAVERMGSAEFNFVLRDEGLSAAEILKKKNGTPYILGSPYGYGGTLEWLEKIEVSTGLSLNPALKARLERKKRMYSVSETPPMMALRRQKHQPSALIEGEYEAVRGVGRFLEESGIKNVKKICQHSLPVSAKPEDGIIHYKEEKERLESVKSVENALVLGSGITLFAASGTNKKILLSFPDLDGYQIARHLPFMGEKGADFITEQVQEYLESL